MRFIGVEVEQETSAPPPKKILDPPLIPQWNMLCPFTTLEARRELEPKCLMQLFPGSLLGKRRSAIGHFFLHL